MKNRILLIMAAVFCSSISNLTAGVRSKSASIINASKAPMPIERKQVVGDHLYRTARAKAGYCFAVKNNKIAYMSVKRAAAAKAKPFTYSHRARREASKYQK